MTGRTLHGLNTTEVTDIVAKVERAESHIAAHNSISIRSQRIFRVGRVKESTYIAMKATMGVKHLNLCFMERFAAPWPSVGDAIVKGVGMP